MIRTTHEDEYYVRYTATPRWPDAQFYCPTPGNCQDSYEIIYTINVNSNACVADPQVDRTLHPETAPYRTELFYFGFIEEYVSMKDAVTNGECGYSWSEPYVANSTDAN